MRRNNAVLPLFLSISLIPFVLALSPPSVAPSVANSAIVDMTGRPVSVVPPAKEIIILPLILADFLAIDQSSGHIIAISGRNREAAKAGLLGKIYPNLLHLPVTGPTVFPSDPELLLELHADAVFALDDRSEILDAIGLRSLVRVRLPDKTLPNESELWKLIGRVTGSGNRAEILIGRHGQRVAALQAMLQGEKLVPERAAILNGADSFWWIANSKRYYLNPQLEFVKAINVGGPVFSSESENTLEDLLTSNPDIVLLDSDAIRPRDLYMRPEYRALRAVKNRKVYSLPTHADSSAVTQELLLSWLAEICYPNRFPHRLREEYRNAYREVYDYAIGDDEIDRLLRVKDNTESAGYSVFSRVEASRLP
jgi:ABC-type Fe3+-hydroxamate transport system substrate-binding protein